MLANFVLFSDTVKIEIEVTYLPDVDKPIVVKTNKYISRRIFSQGGRFFASENDTSKTFSMWNCILCLSLACIIEHALSL